MRVYDNKLKCEVVISRSLDDLVPEKVDGEIIYHFCKMRKNICHDKKYIVACPNYTKYTKLKD